MTDPSNDPLTIEVAPTFHLVRLANNVIYSTDTWARVQLWNGKWSWRYRTQAGEADTLEAAADALRVAYKQERKR